VCPLADPTRWSVTTPDHRLRLVGVKRGGQMLHERASVSRTVRAAILPPFSPAWANRARYRDVSPDSLAEGITGGAMGVCTASGFDRPPFLFRGPLRRWDCRTCSIGCSIIYALRPTCRGPALRADRRGWVDESSPTSPHNESGKVSWRPRSAWRSWRTSCNRLCVSRFVLRFRGSIVP